LLFSAITILFHPFIFTRIKRLKVSDEELYVIHTLLCFLHCTLAAAQCIVIGPVCLFVGVWVGLLPR